jgi:hypothetical protein
MPGATANLGHTWYISTVLLTSLGFYMWPHAFGAAFTAKSGDTLRRSAVVMPLYTLTLAFVFFVGFTAVLVVPGLPQWRPLAFDDRPQKLPTVVLGNNRRSRRPHRYGACRHFYPDRCDSIRQKFLSTHLRAGND